LHLNNKILTGLAFIILGGLSYVNIAGYINLSSEAVVGITLIFYGIPSVYSALGSGKRDWLAISAVFFFVGVLFIVKYQYDLTDSQSMAFASILLIGGAVFLILFIENTKEKVFIVAAFLLLVLGYAATTIFKQCGILNTTNKIANIVDDFLPVILIVWGLSIFLTRKK